MLLPVVPVGLGGYKVDNKSEEEKLFKLLIDGYAKAFPKHSKKQGQLEVSKIWRGMKKTDDLVKSVNIKLCEWKEKEMKLKGNLLLFWAYVGINIVFINIEKLYY